MSKIFKETTRLPKLIYVIFIIQFIFFLLYTSNNREDKSLFYFSVGILIIGVFFALAKLNIKLSEKSIEYGLYPFINKTISWNEIDRIEIIEISALSDFLGWGIRYSKKYGWAYITNSEYGIFITKTNGKKVTLSIKKKTNLIDFLEKNNLYKF